MSVSQYDDELFALARRSCSRAWSAMSWTSSSCCGNFCRQRLNRRWRSGSGRPRPFDRSVDAFSCSQQRVSRASAPSRDITRRQP
jgi:hypothetical protein